MKFSTASGDIELVMLAELVQIDGDDLEELDLRWKVAMLTVRIKNSFRGQEGTWTSKKNDYLEGIKGEDLMVTMAGAMHQANASSSQALVASRTSRRL
ncbi:hypothetical protein Tco_0655464 [Tanacetum coccineum]|uniref:Uncharacterized protein n=1 Tax=Tanacetum coccineum TaxID=301880 RepID=A0ABQ4X6P0_9ASTR